MSDEGKNFWQSHLPGTESPLIHFVPTPLLDLDSIGCAAKEVGFALFVVDAEGIRSELDVMDTFAESMSFPSFFGRNWDALLDLTRDLSWSEAKGYVLVIRNGDALVSIPPPTFSSLIAVMETTVSDWRDERGEYRERTDPVAFHVIFSGGETLKEALLGRLRESLLRTHGEVLRDYL